MIKKEKQGTVTMPLSEYDKIMEELTIFKNIFQVKIGYKNRVEVNIDPNLIRGFLEEKMLTLPEYDPEDYKMLNYLYTSDFTLAQKNDEEE